MLCPFDGQVMQVPPGLSTRSCSDAKSVRAGGRGGGWMTLCAREREETDSSVDVMFYRAAGNSNLTN